MSPLSWTQRPVSALDVQGHVEPTSESVSILLAEDDSSVRSLLVRVLRSRGYSVTEAANGAEAVALAESHPGPFHLLLTDVVMPKLSGPDLAARLLNNGLARRVLYMTGFADVALDTGEHAAVIHKPFTPNALADAVRSALSG